MMDWAKIKAAAISPENRPLEWPKEVQPISMEGLALFGLDASQRLYWDGRLIQVRRMVRLSWWQNLLAAIVAFSALAQVLLVVMSGEGRDAAFSRCHLAANGQSSAEIGDYTSFCMIAAGYHDDCINLTLNGGHLAQCYSGASWLTRMRDYIR